MSLKSTDVQVGDISFHVRRSENEGKPLLLLHGFPDDAGSFDLLVPSLLDWGYQLTIPYMRGYGPTEADPNGHYHIHDLASDVIGLMDAFGLEKATVIGHDWGAIAGYGAAQMAPERMEALYALSVPPAGAFLGGVLRNPRQLLRSRYMAAFQFQKAISKKTIERLWRRWSPGWDIPPARLEAVHKTFGHSHTPEAAISYYHQLLPRGPGGLKRWRETQRLVFSKIHTKTTLVTGAMDGGIGPALFRNLEKFFSQPMTLHVLPDVGHFLHQENPEAVLGALSSLQTS